MSYQTTTYPTTIDVPVNPVGTDSVATFDHAGLEDFQNNAIAAIEAKVGANSSAVTTSHDYKLSGVTGSDKAVSKTGSETLTNKTLTTPTITVPVIADFSSANHNHTNAAGGGTLAETSLALTDITTNDVSTSKHGFAPKLPNDALKFLNGVGAYSTPTTTTPSTSTLVPPPAFPASGITDFATSSNTTLRVGRVYVPIAITATKFYFNTTAVSASGTVKVCLFSDDGQTQVITFTSATISGSGIVATTIGSTLVSAGFYYIGILPVSTANVSPNYYTSGGDTTDALNIISAKPGLVGTLTVTASTMPATITPSSIVSSSANGACLVFRLDA